GRAGQPDLVPADDGRAAQRLEVGPDQLGGQVLLGHRDLAPLPAQPDLAHDGQHEVGDERAETELRAALLEPEDRATLVEAHERVEERLLGGGEGGHVRSIVPETAGIAGVGRPRVGRHARLGNLAGVITDLPLEQLRTYRPEVAEPADFDEFWARTIAEARAAGGAAESVPADTPVTAVRVEDVTFPGFGGEPVRAWYLAPHADGPLPCVVEFIGYGGGRGLPHEHLAHAAAGYAHLVMDTRGQGSSWGTGGDTPDPHGAGPAFAGMMTRGIESPDTYYYRRLVTDAVRAVDHVLTRPEVDPTRVAVTGISQGGGLALAAGALHDQVAAVAADVPFLCHFERAVRITDARPYSEIAAYLSVRR